MMNVLDECIFGYAYHAYHAYTQSASARGRWLLIWNFLSIRGELNVNHYIDSIV